MESKLQKQIVDYFSFFDEFYTSAKTCLKNCQNRALIINKLIVRCRKIKGADVNGTPCEDFAGLQSRLVASLHCLISEEISEINNNLTKVEELLEKLCAKNNTLQENCKCTDLPDQSILVKGSPFQPPLKKLLNYCTDTVTFGSQIYAQIETSINILTFKGLNTDSLVDNFKEPTDWQLRIKEILTYTSFCSENQI